VGVAEFGVRDSGFGKRKEKRGTVDNEIGHIAKGDRLSFE
jgi:hypothetical protein